MRRRTLLNAIAALAGRESPEQQTPAQIQPEPEAPFSVDEARAQGRLILLVDDNLTNLKVISQQLNMLGYLAETAEDGAVALEMWHAGNYSLILTDCHMPIMDGYQLSEIIRREETLGTRIPIIATTADALKGTAQRCFDAGMNDYLTKPMKLQQLREALEKWAPKIDVEDETAEEQAFTPGSDMSHADIEPNALGNILGTKDPKVLAEYYTSFLETNTSTVVQIQAAFNANDLSEVSRLAHKLKSSARTIGANRLGDCCQALEEAGKEDNTTSIRQQMKLLPVLFNGVKNWIEHSYAAA
jgi:CheY-like chemotaxis protein/HPt (histidine-containing phosphotransfer) domain-containing protein